MPKLWTETIDAHRREVRDAVLDATAGLVRDRGLRAVTMSSIADETGIGRATLYKYFAGVDEILVAWHEREVGRHLAELEEVARQPGDANEQLAAVLEAYAHLAHGHRGSEHAAGLHRAEHVVRAEERVCELLSGVIARARDRGVVRDDVPPAELAAFCLHALAAAQAAPSDDAIRRLIDVIAAGLRAPRAGGG